MKGLPPQADFSRLEGAVLQQVRFSSHQLQLIFGDSLRVAVEDTCVLSNEETGESTRIDDFAASATQLCNLLGKSLVDAKRTAKGGLSLRFNTSHNLEMLVGGGAMESFQVHMGDQILVA